MQPHRKILKIHLIYLPPRFSLLGGSSAWAAMNEEYLFLERECSFLEAGMFAANPFFSKCIC